MTFHEPPTQFERSTRFAQYAALGCSAFAALGTGLGYCAAGGNLLVSAAGGLVLAEALGVGWNMAIGSAR
jgi:hypothetical protein